MLVLIKQSVIFVFLGFLFLMSCKKDKDNTVTENPSTIPEDTSVFACKNLPAAPQPQGWRDTTTDENKNINTYMFNPANPDEIIYVVNGDMFGFNKMYNYHIPTRRTTYLANVSEFAPQINKYGWILFSTVDNEVYKIKSNGDSITKLTIGNRSQDPKWDHTDRGIYLFQLPYNTTPPRLLKFNIDGFPLLNYDIEMPYTAAFKKSNKIIFLKTNLTSISLIQKDINPPNAEKIILTVPYSATATTVYFDNITLDNNDENVYWSNAAGIIKCNLNSLQVDTVLKNCQTIRYDNPYFQSTKPNSMMVTARIIKNLNAFQLLHTYKAVEYNVLSKEKTEIKIFP